MNNKGKADFCIEVDFEKGAESPSRVFRAMTEIIETFQDIDKALVGTHYILTEVKDIIPLQKQDQFRLLPDGEKN